MAVKGTRVAQRSTANAGQGAKAGMRAAPYKPTAKLGGSDAVGKPVNYSNVPMSGVGKTNPKAQPMFPGKPSKLGKTTDQYGTGLLQGKAPGYQNRFSDDTRGSGRPVSGTQKGQ